MKRQTALYMLEWFVYTVVAVGLATAVWLMPAGGAAWMVVWIMLGLCAVPLVRVVRYYPFWSIVVSVVTHLLVWLSLGMGRHGWGSWAAG